MTRKLYYEDCHLSAFSARVLTCAEENGRWVVTLDATAFYPEGGGQAADCGTLGGVSVLDTQERGGEIVHICDGPLTAGSEVAGEIDYAARFDRMQQHTGEHIVSGIIHRRWGWQNVGFHMGADVVTIDFDGDIPAEALPEIEAEANRAVYADIPLHIWYPSEAELPGVPYRTKRALPWPVRVVEVTGYDTCACCGVHTASTGEVGLVKLFSVQRFHQGVRMEIACGRRALELLSAAYEQNKQVSQAFSAKLMETGAAARRMNELLAAEKYRVTGLQKQIFRMIADSCAGCGDTLRFARELEPAMVRELADAIAERCGGIAAVFSGDDGAGYSFCLVTRCGDLRALGKAMTGALSGRGGGKPALQQGRVGASRVKIEEFFASYGK